MKLSPKACAEQFELYAEACEQRSPDRAYAYKHCAQILREFACDFEPIPDYCELMKLKDWIEQAEDGGFTDYDGDGFLATLDAMSAIKVHPSEVNKLDIPKWCTHIAWFNR
jgi:hypothetical protein